jgi:hypothetical protein
MLLSSLAPTGGMLCVAPDGHAELEAVDRPCCAGKARPGDAAPARQAPGGDDCDGCSDVVFSDAVARHESSSAASVTTVASLPVVPIEAIYAPPMSTRAASCGRLTPARMAEIRSVVIRI